jgi:hypothetical protein
MELNVIVVLNRAAALSNTQTVSAVDVQAAVRREFTGQMVHLVQTVLAVDEQSVFWYSVSSQTSQASQTVSVVPVQAAFS